MRCIASTREWGTSVEQWLIRDFSFFRYRHPLLGLFGRAVTSAMDLRRQSFSLLTVFCALGSVVSPRPRDRLLHPILRSMAEKNVEWCMTHGLRSLELIQALACLSNWKNASDRHTYDRSGQRIKHAVQLARDTGLFRTASVRKRVDALFPSQAAEDRHRWIRVSQECVPTD